MAVALRQSRRFGASSPVTRYWLAHCVGFAVSGGASGVVVAVHADDDPHEARALVVRRGRRTLTLPVDAVLAVVPAERVLVVGPARPGPAGPRRAEAALAPVAALARLAARRGGALARRARTEGVPLAAALVRRARDDGSRLIASVPWQRSGRFARSATTSLLRDLSRLWSRLRTTWSRLRSASGS